MPPSVSCKARSMARGAPFIGSSGVPSRKTMAMPGKAPRALPLVEEAMATPRRSTGAAPSELTASIARRIPWREVMVRRTSRSLRTPVEVSPCVLQIHAGRDLAQARSMAAGSKGSPQSAVIRSKSSPARLAWSTRRSPKTPFERTRPGLAQLAMTWATASFPSVPEPGSSWTIGAPVIARSRSTTRARTAATSGERCEIGSRAMAARTRGRSVDGPGRKRRLETGGRSFGSTRKAWPCSRKDESESRIG